MQVLPVQAAESSLEKYIEIEVKNAKEQLKEQPVLVEKIDVLWAQLQSHSKIEMVGTDEQLRAAFVSMQAILEMAITQALKDKFVGKATAYIITPKAPTPLTMETIEAKTFANIDPNDPKDFARLRNPVQINFLEAGGVINSYNAAPTLDPVFAKYLSKYPIRIINHPTLKECPPDKTGALYYADDFVIAIQSVQISQIAEVSGQKIKWAILFNEQAAAREKEIMDFIK